jgi:hypothetical protein
MYGQVWLNLFLSLALDGVGQPHAPALLFPRKVSFAHAGIQTPYRSARNLLTTPSTLFRLRSSSSSSSSNDKNGSEFYKFTMLSFRHTK